MKGVGLCALTRAMPAWLDSGFHGFHAWNLDDSNPDPSHPQTPISLGGQLLDAHLENCHVEA